MKYFDQDPEEKGLFTFYREQAEFQEQMNKLKKQRRQQKIDRLSGIQEDPLPIQPTRNKAADSPKKVKKTSPVLIKSEKLVKMKNANPYFSGHNKDGYSVARFNNETQKLVTHRLEPKSEKEFFFPKKGHSQYENEIKYKKQFKKKPSAFISAYLRKSEDRSNKKHVAERLDESGLQSIILLANFNEEKQRAGQLPNIRKGLRSSSELTSMKKYKSRRVEAAMNSGSKEFIRMIRESIKAESLGEVSENVAYINYLENSGEQEGPDRLEGLNQHQRRLISILSGRKK